MSLSITGQRTKGSSASRPFDLDLDLAIPDSGVTALIGASGSGKTSTLRILAGLDRFQGFNVRLGEEVWQDQRVFRPPHLRPVAMVTQQPNLFPHQSARDNLRAALRATQHSSARGLSDLDGAVERFGIGHLLDRKPAALSGGERQRVALARASLRPARIWMLDEPLAALDALARANLAPLVAQLCAAASRPVLYVTHSLAEVLQIADHLVVMESGRVIASGAPEAVAAALDHPLSPLIEVGAILDCAFVAYDARYGLSELRVGGVSLWVRGDLDHHGGRVRIQIPARDVVLARAPLPDSSVLNCLPASVVSAEPTPNGDVGVELECEGQRLRARITALSAARMALVAGDRVYALIKSVALEARQG
jgi:molybdate transport system ATP-binding protein